MSSTAVPAAPGLTPCERLEVLFEELAELTGQRNAIDGRIVAIVSEIHHDQLWGATGVRSLPALVAWKTGVSPANAHTVTAIAERLPEFPRCTSLLRAGRLSLDQVGVIAERAAGGSDAHYAELAPVATVSQLRTAVKLEPRPPKPRPAPEPSISKTVEGEYTTWRIRLARLQAATFDAALRAHHDGLIADWKHDHAPPSDADADDSADAPDTGADDASDAATAADDASDAATAADHRGDAPDGDSVSRPPLPTNLDAFMSLVGAGWDSEAARRPHGQHSTVVVHVDLAERLAALHLGPLLADAERQYLLCDATCEVWFERDGRPIGAGRATRTLNRRLRRALEHRDHGTCVVPGCEATRGLHAHHLHHWEDGGTTELSNLVLVCPYHHRLHHHGLITLTGPAERLTVTDSDGRTLSSASLARPPTTPPPAVPAYTGPTGERADWWWYTPFQPQPPPPN